MENVYIVYYDNGHRWEDHQVTVNKVFSSLQTAQAYADEKNAPLQTFTPYVTKEKYESENWAEDTGYTYEEFVQNEQYDWAMTRDSKYYVLKEQVC